MVLISAFAMLGAIGCKQEEPSIPANEYPTRMASGYCEAVYGCQCESYPYDNFNECLGDLSVAYDELNAVLPVVGRAVALEILVEGRVWGAREAFEKGLVNRVVPHDG